MKKNIYTIYMMQTQNTQESECRAGQQGMTGCGRADTAGRGGGRTRTGRACPDGWHTEVRKAKPTNPKDETDKSQG